MPTDLPTRDDYFDIGSEEVFSRSSVRTRSTRISPEAVTTEGTDINIIIAACSAMADEATRHLSLRMAALFLDSAEGDDLDRLVADRFSPTIVRKQAAPAVVTVDFFRSIPPSGGAAVIFPIGTKLRTEQGTEFVTTTVASLALNSTGPVPAVAEAVQAGTVGNVEKEQITAFVQTPTDPEAQVINPAVASGGTDIETDAQLRERARDFFRVARRGTLAAIEFGALTVNGVESATATEILDGLGKPTGVVQLQIADVNGNSNAILADAVKNALFEFRAAGVVVDILLSAPQLEDIAYTLAFRPATDTNTAIQQLKTIVDASVNLLAPGEPLLRSLLIALARSIPGAIVTEDSVVTPATDITPGVAKTIKTSIDRVTVNGL